MLSRPVSQMISVSVPMIAATIGFSGPGRHRAVEAEVVAQEDLRLVERREHPGDLVRHPGQVLARGPLGGEAGGPDLEHPARLVHLVEREAVESGQELERRPPELRRPLHDERAGPATRRDDAHRLQGAEPGPQGRTAQAHREGELPLGGQAVAGAEAAGFDLPPNVLDDEGARRGVRAQGSPPFLGRPPRRPDGATAAEA